MAEKKLYEINVNSNFDDLVRLEKQLELLNQDQKEIEKTWGKATKSYQVGKAEVAKTSKQMAELRKEIVNNEKANKGLGNSYDNLTAQNSILAKRLRAIQDPLGKNKQQFQEIAKQIDNNTNKLKTMDAAMGRQQRNVGNYGNAFNSLTPMMGRFGGQISMLQSTFSGLTKSLAGADKAQKTTAISSRLLGLAMMSIPIIAIVGAFVALISAFAGTQRGADALSRVVEPLKAIFGALLGIIQKLSFTAFDGLKKAMKDPEQAFKDLGKIIVENILNRFKAFTVFLDAIVLAMKGDFKGAFKKGTDAVIQFNTGIADGTDKLEKNLKTLYKTTEAARLVGLQIAELNILIDKSELENIVPIAELRLRFEELKELSKDQMQTDAVRMEALKEAIQIQEDISDREKKIIDLKLERMRLEQGINDTNRTGNKEYQQLVADRLNFEAEATKNSLRLSAQLSGFEKKILQERLKQEREFYEARDLDAKFYADLKIKQAKFEAKELLRIQADQQKRAEELAKKQQEKEDSQRKEEIARANSEMYKQAEEEVANKELLKANAIQLAQQTSDAIFDIQRQNLERRKRMELRALETQTEFERDILKSQLESGLISQEEYENNRTALKQRTDEAQAQIEKKAFERNKRLQIAQAIANGALAITNIMATVPKVDFGVATAIMIGTAIASTAIQIGTIASTKFAKGGLLEGKSHAQGGIQGQVGGRPIELEGGETVINKKSTKQFLPVLDYINRAGGGVPLMQRGGYIRKFANGGMFQANQNAEMINGFSNQMNKIRVINVASDTIGTFKNATRIENEFTL